MSRVIIHVDATVGSPIGKGSSAHREHWPVGWGTVRDTLADDGRPAEAMVLMREPALPGCDVVSRPIAVLHLKTDPPHDAFLCVSTDKVFVDLDDLADLSRWHAAAEVWLAALDRLDPDHPHRVGACGPKDEADRLLTDVQHEYFLLTGCLE
jgi:inorganic pyrophosphatase